MYYYVMHYFLFELNKLIRMLFDTQWAVTSSNRQASCTNSVIKLNNQERN